MYNGLIEQFIMPMARRACLPFTHSCVRQLLSFLHHLMDLLTYGKRSHPGTHALSQNPISQSNRNPPVPFGWHLRCAHLPVPKGERHALPLVVLFGGMLEKVLDGGICLSPHLDDGRVQNFVHVVHFSILRTSPSSRRNTQQSV